jgi:hypothetical protein
MASVAFLSKACSTKYQQTNYESGQQIKVAWNRLFGDLQTQYPYQGFQQWE